MKAPNSGNGVLGFLGKNFKIVVGVIIALLLVGFADSLMTADKIYAGVHIGKADVGGLTQEQAVAKIDEVYGPRMDAGHIVIYAGEEGKAKALAGEVEILPEDQLSVEEVAAATVKWDVYPYEIGISEPKSSWAEQAYAWGRTEGGPFARILSMVLGKTIAADLSFDEDKFEELGKKIDMTLGETRVDWNIAITDGVATVTEGKDGFMVDRDKLKEAIQTGLMESEDGQGEYVAKAEKAPIRINQKQAKAVCDRVNIALADGLVVTYKDFSRSIDKNELGNWVSTKVTKNGNNWDLVPTVKGDRSRSVLLSTVRQDEAGPSIAVTIDVVDKTAYVHPSESGIIPDVSKGIDDLDQAMFGENGKKNAGSPISLTLQETQSPDQMTLQEALDYGFVEEISKFEISYNTGPGNEAKVNNIHLMASELNNTVCKVDGMWSFNDIVGDTTPDKGYQAAGTIVEGQYSESIGGGICAVATTVFNAVYNAGLTVAERHNHSLYISSYPLGRDAAINYPDMDLIWKNDLTSDILLCMGYTDDTVNATLYGISPHYKVTTEEGEWEEGEKYRTVVKVDEDLPEGYKYVDVSGTDGSKISVIRNVFAPDGSTVCTNRFTSVYEAKNEVIVCGPNTKVEKRQDSH